LLTSFSQPLYFDPGSFSEAVRPETKRPAHRKAARKRPCFFMLEGFLDRRAAEHRVSAVEYDRLTRRRWQ
jgi:hypothetical protein